MKTLALALLCVVFALPVAAQPTIRILSIDSANMGGFYNFRFSIEDGNRLRQAFGGRELRIEFKPAWRPSWFPSPRTSASFPCGNYGCEVVITDNTLHEIVARDTVFPAGMYEHAAIFAGGNDSTGIGHPDSRLKELRTGSVILSRSVQEAFGFTFDYALQQWGGIYRMDTAYISGGSANARVERSTYGTALIGEDSIGNDIVYRGYNHGAAIYDVEFLPGGMETMSLKYGPQTNGTVTVVDVLYLNVRVTNNVSYKRPLSNGDSITVRYPNEVRHATVVVKDLNKYDLWPTPTDIPIGEYNLTAYAWVNGRQSNRFLDRPHQAAVPSDAPLLQNSGVPVGTQGRYYLSATNSKGDTVDFVHIFLASGTEFGLDYANKSGRRSIPLLWEKDAPQPTKDFEVGDQVRFSTFGGALGFPMPSASIVVRVDTTTTGVPQTDELPFAVAVSPHPFSSTAVMQYTLPRPQNVTLTIFDQLGNRVHTLVDTKQEAGKHTIALGEPRLQRGMYMYRLQAGQQVVHGTFLVVP